MNQVIVVTGAATGPGSAAACELAKAGHTVYACVNSSKRHGASPAKAAKKFAKEHGVDLRPLEFDDRLHQSAEAMVERILRECGRLDVLIHNAGSPVFGPAEAFTPEQLAQLFDTIVLSTQRVNRAALPTLREQGQGLVMWIGSSTMRGGVPPYLGAYFAAKASADALALSYAAELARWNIETSMILPVSFLSSAGDPARLKSPEDRIRLKEYTLGPTAGLARQIMRGIDWPSANDAEAMQIARTIVAVVSMPFGTRPLRVHVDPAQDRAELANDVADRLRAEMLRNMGLADLLNPSAPKPVEIYS